MGAPTLIGCGSYCATVPGDFQKYATAVAVPAIEDLRLSRSASAIGRRCSLPFQPQKKGYPFPRIGETNTPKKAKKRGLPRFPALAVF